MSSAPRVVPRNGKKSDVLLVKASSSMWARDMAANGALFTFTLSSLRWKKTLPLKMTKTYLKHPEGLQFIISQ